VCVCVCVCVCVSEQRAITTHVCTCLVCVCVCVCGCVCVCVCMCVCQPAARHHTPRVHQCVILQRGCIGRLVGGWENKFSNVSALVILTIYWMARAPFWEFLCVREHVLQPTQKSVLKLFNLVNWVASWFLRNFSFWSPKLQSSHVLLYLLHQMTAVIQSSENWSMRNSQKSARATQIPIQWLQRWLLRIHAPTQQQTLQRTPTEFLKSQFCCLFKYTK